MGREMWVLRAYLRCTLIGKKGALSDVTVPSLPVLIALYCFPPLQKALTSSWLNGLLEWSGFPLVFVLLFVSERL